MKLGRRKNVFFSESLKTFPLCLYRKVNSITYILKVTRKIKIKIKKKPENITAQLGHIHKYTIFRIIDFPFVQKTFKSVCVRNQFINASYLLNGKYFNIFFPVHSYQNLEIFNLRC